MEFLSVLTRNATMRFVVSLVVAAGVWGSLLMTPYPTQIVMVWNSFAFTLMALSAVTFSITSPSQIRKVAQMEDTGRVVIFALVLGAACVSLLAILLLMRRIQGENAFQLVSMIAAVTLSWIVVHTAFCFRYAHLYYDRHASKPGSEARGLVFPDEEEPDYWDFAYFSFVIGMTAQVSDVTISARRMRRIALLHGVISFVFNAVIIALTISVVSGVV